MLQDWTVTTSDHTCRGCGAEIPPRRPFFSCLRQQDAGLERRDYCPDCWEEGLEARLQDVFCFWRTRRPEDPDQRKVDTELMLEFFERLRGSDAENKKVFRFVLGLYLVRRKEFRLQGFERRDGAEYLLLTRRGGGKQEKVENPGLTEEQIQETARHLEHLLDAEL